MTLDSDQLRAWVGRSEAKIVSEPIGAIPVVFNRYLAHNGKIYTPPPIDGQPQVHTHCADCLKAFVAEFNERYTIVQTVPPTLIDRKTGELVDPDPKP